MRQNAKVDKPYSLAPAMLKTLPKTERHQLSYDIDVSLRPESPMRNEHRLPICPGRDTSSRAPDAEKSLLGISQGETTEDGNQQINLTGKDNEETEEHTCTVEECLKCHVCN